MFSAISPVHKVLLVIAGPTAVGKTAASVELAQRFDTHVVSADSRQLYHELTIGTAKPTPAEMNGIRHHFIDSHSIQHVVSAGQYEREALELLIELFREKDVVILTGGTGLYINALCFGLDDIPAIDPAIRENLMQQLRDDGLDSLLRQLRGRDPVFAATADLQNTQRVVRALEVSIGTGQPFSAFQQKRVAPRPFRPVLCALDRPRTELYSRIDARVETMLTNGLIEEVRGLMPFHRPRPATGPSLDPPPLRTVGYSEVFAYLDRQIDYDEMRELIKRNTRRYAKRQLTWFRNQGDYQWFTPDTLPSRLSDFGR